MSVAFLVIDVQEDYVNEPGLKESFAFSVEYINYVSNLFREKGLPVIHIRHIDEGDDESREGLKVSSRIVQKEGDLYVVKTYGNAFWKTELDDVLKNLGVDFVICSGLAAAHCVLATYNGAIERGYGVNMLQNGIIGRTKEEVDVVSKETNGMSYVAIRYLLEQIK